jgi:hypothetical protein
MYSPVPPKVRLPMVGTLTDAPFVITPGGDLYLEANLR